MRIAVCLLIVAGLTYSGCSKSNEDSKTKMEDASTAIGQKSTSAQVMLPTPASPSDYIGEFVAVENGQTIKYTNFSWKNTKGETVQLKDFAKGKPVFLNFWATWCGPCKREIPDIIECSKEFKDVVFIGVALENGENPETKVRVGKFMDTQGMTYTNIVGNGTTSTRTIQEAYAAIQQIEAIPTTFIFDKNGNLKSTIIGMNTKAGFTEAIKKAL
ncbi:MAG: TlpA family protein disulfide reductase [Candidatus Kapabacteria bacterium]|nr:TlpA family protein disulfide reductase [Candidatus Kapabacteria bacterium]